MSDLQEVEDQGLGTTLTRREAVTMGLALAGGYCAGWTSRVSFFIPAPSGVIEALM